MGIRDSFGQRLRELRVQKGWTQEELSKRAGFHRTYVGNIERGLENPTIEAVSQLADALDVSVKTLFDLEEANVEEEAP